MNDRIRFGEPIEPELLSEALPPISLLLSKEGEYQSKSSFQVYIVKSVYSQIFDHIRQSPQIESGGILIGHPFKTPDNQIVFVIVSAAIPQHSNNRSIAHFTVGPQEIAIARLEMEEKYPGLMVVGWYHSHPGHGVFLSGQDMTIVRGIYNSDWHIALVIDPVRQEEGVFIGPNGEQVGSRGGKPLGSSWLGLSEAPDSIRAVAIYNQAKHALNERRITDALETLKALKDFVFNSNQLPNWEQGYRDLASLQSQLEVLQKHDQMPGSKSKSDKLLYNPPQPVRMQENPNYNWWLWLCAIASILFAVFFSFVAVFWPEKGANLITISWGIVLSLLTMIASGYIITAKARLQTKSAKQTRVVYSIYERLGALILIALITFTWIAYITILYLYPPSTNDELLTGTFTTQSLPTLSLTPGLQHTPVLTTPMQEPLNELPPTSILTNTPIPTWHQVTESQTPAYPTGSE